MKPKILIWAIYLVLGYLVLDAVVQMLGVFLGNYQFAIGGFQHIVTDKYTVEDGYQTVGDNHRHFPVAPVISAIVSIVAIIGLARRIAWARIIAIIAIVAEVISVIGFTIYAYLTIDIKEVTDILLSSLVSAPIFYIPLLFLAYKIYTSEPLKAYLSRPPPRSA